MASRYDQPDAGTGIDSNIYDERPMDAADELPDALYERESAAA